MAKYVNKHYTGKIGMANEVIKSCISHQKDAKQNH